MADGATGLRVLITRPEAEGRRLAARLADLGHEAVLSPVLDIRTCDFDWPTGPFSAVVMTSANAASAALAHSEANQLTAQPVFCVGDKAADLLRNAPFGPALDIRSGGKDVRSLAQNLDRALARDGPPLLFLRGRDVARPLETLLPDGPGVIDRIVYEAIARDHLNDIARADLRRGRIDAALHFSPRSARAVCDAARRDGVLVDLAACHHVCLSQAVADAVRAGFANDGGDRAGATEKPDLSIAAHPDEAGLLDALAAYCGDRQG